MTFKQWDIWIYRKTIIQQIKKSLTCCLFVLCDFGEERASERAVGAEILSCLSPLLTLGQMLHKVRYCRGNISLINCFIAAIIDTCVFQGGSLGCHSVENNRAGTVFSEENKINKSRNLKITGFSQGV